jgi:hypothetical protein
VSWARMATRKSKKTPAKKSAKKPPAKRSVKKTATKNAPTKAAVKAAVKAAAKAAAKVQAPEAPKAKIAPKRRAAPKRKTDTTRDIVLPLPSGYGTHGAQATPKFDFPGWDDAVRTLNIHFNTLNLTQTNHIYQVTQTPPPAPPAASFPPSLPQPDPNDPWWITAGKIAIYLALGAAAGYGGAMLFLPAADKPKQLTTEHEQLIERLIAESILKG